MLFSPFTLDLLQITICKHNLYSVYVCITYALVANAVTQLNETEGVIIDAQSVRDVAAIEVVSNVYR